MRTIVGKVEAVEGKFFAKDSSGNVIELHLGDMITSDMLVYGDKSNSSSSSIQIALVALGEIINLNGTEQQSFDSSLVADGLESEGISPENVKIALEKTALADKNEIAKDAKEELAILDETAAGEERAKSTDTVEGEFAARDGASVDINTDLRAASFTTDTNNFEPTKIIIEEPQTPAELTTVTLSLAGQAMTEEGVAATYTINTSKPVLNEMQIEVKISNVTTDGDIVEEIRTVVIPTGSTSVTFSLDNVDDAIKENPEDYKVEIINVQNGGFDTVGFADKEVVTTITDEASPIDREVGATVSITGAASVTEGSIATYTVHTDTVSSKDIVVNVTTGHITTQDGDYTPVTQAVTILAGNTAATFTVQTTDDNLAEPTETYNVRIVSASGDEFEEIAISPTTNSVNTDIVDNDLPKITINDMTVNEADGFMTFTVTLSNPSTSPVTVDYHTVDGTSTAGLDYTQTSGTLTFTPGEITQTITVPVNDDFINEGSETLDLVLTNATITDNTGLGIIQDEPTPGSEDTISVTLSGDISVTEGATAAYTVTLSQNTLTPMDIDVVIGHDTTNNGDLVARTITVTVPAGSNSVDFTVSNNDDVYAEGDETYVVALSGLTTGGGFEAVDVDTTPVNTVISDNTTPGTEVDEEVINVTLSGDETVNEGALATYTITLDAPTTAPMQVEVQTGHITTDDGDLIPTTMMVTIAANATSATFTVANTQDTTKEGNEDYTVSLTGNTVGGGFETINVNTTPVTTTINDDDVLSIRINNVSVNEDAGSMTFVVSLSTTSASDVTFDYASLNQTALDGLDYTAVSGSGIITAGNLTTTITVPVTDDYIKENAETLLMNLTNVTPGVVLADVQGVGTILDEGTPGASDTVTVNIAGSSDVNEANAATYTVSTDKAVETDMTVDVTYSFTSASGGDIVTNTVQVTIPAGATTAPSFNVATVDDVYAEGDEVFNVTISNPQGGGVEKVVLGTSTVATTIHDDKTPGTEENQETALVSITGASDVNEGNAALYTVSVDSPTTEALNVSVTYSYTSASSGDIVTNTVLVTIPANSSSVDFNVATVDDAYAEGDEVYNVNISNPVGGGFENVAVDAAQATVATTIHDNTTPGTEDNDEVINVTLSGATTVAEGGVATYTITLDAPTATPMQVEVQTGHITTENGDLIPTTMLVDIPANASTVDFTVANNQDLITEGNEDYNVVLTGLTNGGGFETINVNTTPVVTTIIDDEGKPSITINDVTVNEDAGTMEFTVTLSNPTTEDVTFNYASADQSAVAGADYTAVSGLGTITAGTTTTKIIVPITDDYIAEANEKFVINLTNPSANAVIADVQGVGTITDEPTPSNPEDTLTLTLSGDLNVEESNSASYRVTADKAPQTDLTVTIKTGHIDTVTGDFVEVNTTVTIPANQTFVDFSVQTNDDAYAEGAERYTVTMSNPTGGGVEAIALGNTVVTTTINDEISPASEDTATVSISGSTTVIEGETATYTVSVNRVPTTDLFVDVETGHITTENGDYTPVITTVKIAAGTQSAQFTVNTLDDALAEVTEDYKVSITDVNGGGFEKTIIGVSQVVTAITDEINPTDKDVGATVSITGDATVWEGNTATYTVTTDTVSTSPILVSVVTGHIETDDGDLTPVSTTVTIPAGQTSATFTVQTTDDAIADSGERFTASITGASGAEFEAVAVDATANSVTTTIVDAGSNIATLTSAIAGNENSATVTYTMTLDTAPTADETFTFNVDGVAQSITVAAGQTTGETTVTITDPDVFTDVDSVSKPTDLVASNNSGYEQLTPVNSATAHTALETIDTTKIFLTGDTSAIEGNVSTYHLSLEHPADTDMQVTVVTGYIVNEADSNDFTPITETFTIKAGDSIPKDSSGNEIVITVATTEDSLVENNEDFTVSVSGFSGGNFEDVDFSSASVTTTIIDDDFIDNNETSSAAEEATQTGTVLENTTDTNGLLLSVTAFSVGAQTGTVGSPLSIANVGDITINVNGSYTFTPVANYNGTVPTINYTVSNGESTDDSTLSITVTPVNDAPIAELSNITINEDTTYTYKLSDFNYSDADGDALSAIRVDSLPVMGDLYYNGVLVTSSGLEVTAANIELGLLTFKPDEHDSGSDQYDGDTSWGNVSVPDAGVGEQQESYGQFEFSVTDGTNWSTTSGTMTIDVNAVADAPTLSVSTSTIVTQQITVDSVHLTNAGFVVNAYNASTDKTISLGSLGTISTHGTYGSTAVNGFGVAGVASGADDEIGYNSILGTAETIVVTFDTTVSSVDMALSWNAPGEDVAIAFYYEGALIETVRTGGGTDLNEAEKPYKPSNGALFDEIRFYPPDAGDDFLIHSISFEREIISSGLAVVDEGQDIALNITSALVDTDASEALTLVLQDIPAGAIISDGVNTFTATATTTSTDITGWNLNALTFNMPNIDAAAIMYTLNIVATSTEYSNGDQASTTLPIEITVQDRNYVSLSNDVAQVDEADILNIGTNHSNTLETAIGNILSDDTLSVGSTLTSINGVTAVNGIITVTTAEGNTLVVNADVNSANYGDYTYTLNNAVDHPSAGNDTVAETFTYTVTAANGATSSANLVVTIVDDTPVASPQTIDLVVEPITTNIVFILDISGSMNDTELKLEADARDYLISQYKEFGDVNVMQTQFESNAITTPWMDSNSLYGTPLRTDGNMTDYEAALNSVMSNYNTNKPVADQTIIYFISDGAITEGSKTSWNAPWEAFIAQDSITKLFTYGIGTSGTDLNAVALPNEDVKSPDPITVTSITQLQNVVSDTVQIYTEGSLVKDASGNSIIDFGADADGAHIASIEINNNIVNYDANNITQTISGLHGDFVINFNTGAYRYVAKDYIQYTEALKASIVDGDGDTLNTVLLNINVSVSAELRTFDGGIHFEDYNTNTSGWTNAGLENNALFIDSGLTASKTFAVHANETVSFSFDAQTQDNWESGDNFTIKDANGKVLYEHFDDYTGPINFEATADASGAIKLNIFVNTDKGVEELHLDNLVVTREYSTDAAFSQTTGIFTLTDEVSVDFDQLAKQIDNLQKIDLSDADKQKVSLTLDDVLDMTSASTNHTLVIAGDNADTLQIDKTGWTSGSVTTNAADGTTTYEYSNGTSSVSLVVDDNIQNSGF